MIELPYADSPYAIYALVPETAGAVLDPYQAPWTINYKTGLSTTLTKKDVQVLGEVVELYHYKDYDPATGIFSTPLVKETFTYNRDPVTGWANYREQVAYFYLEDGTIGPHPKVFKLKPYRTIGQKRAEIERKKKNQTSRASEVAVGALMQGLGMNLADASEAGKAYWSSLVNEISQYEQGNPFPLRARLEADLSPAWVPAVKDFVLAELV